MALKDELGKLSAGAQAEAAQLLQRADGEFKLVEGQALSAIGSHPLWFGVVAGASMLVGFMVGKLI